MLVGNQHSLHDTARSTQHLHHLEKKELHNALEFTLYCTNNTNTEIWTASASRPYVPVCGCELSLPFNVHFGRLPHRRRPHQPPGVPEFDEFGERDLLVRVANLKSGHGFID